MPNFAVLNTNNTVANLIVADSLEIAQESTNSVCVLFNLEDGFVFVGDLYDQETNTFSRETPIEETSIE